MINQDIEMSTLSLDVTMVTAVSCDIEMSTIAIDVEMEEA